MGSPARAPTAATADDRPLRHKSTYSSSMGSPARAPTAATADDRPLRQKSTSCSMGSPGLAPTAAHANGRPQPHPHTCGSPTGSPSSAAPTRAAPSTCTLPRTRCACHLGSRCEWRRERAGTSWRMRTSRPRPQQAPAFAERRPAKKGSMPRSTRTASRKGTVGAPARERCDQRRCESRAAARVQAHSARQVRCARLRESGSRPHVALSSSVARTFAPPLLEKATRPASRRRWWSRPEARADVGGLYCEGRREKCEGRERETRFEVCACVASRVPCRAPGARWGTHARPRGEGLFFSRRGMMRTGRDSCSRCGARRMKNTE